MYSLIAVEVATACYVAGVIPVAIFAGSLQTFEFYLESLSTRDLAPHPQSRKEINPMNKTYRHRSCLNSELQ